MSTQEEDRAFGFGMTIGFILTIIFCVVVLHLADRATNRSWKQEAVEKGKAEWVLDQQSGSVDWRWKP